MKIALIGAGAAGAACVSVLRSRGADFQIFEKSRGAGGRLATRRVKLPEQNIEVSYDHGAPAFEWSNELNTRLSNIIQTKTLCNFEKSYVSSPGMTQLVKDLLGTTQVQSLAEIQAIEGHAKQWFLLEKPQAQSNSPARSFGPFDAVVITAPAPQATQLLSRVPCAWKSELAKISYAPCWALMFAVANSQQTHATFDTATFSSVLLQNVKPGRPQLPGIQAWVAQASTSWSTAHLEHSADEIVNQLLPLALSAIGADAQQVIHSTAHRWRYSTVLSGVGHTMLNDDENGLHYAGDGCLAQGLAGAIESGLTLGHHLVNSTTI